MPKAKPAGFDVRAADGTVLLAATDIRGYEWATHTLTVSEAAKTKLTESDPAEFVVWLDGKAVYRGKFWRALADEPCPGPVILLGDTPNDRIRIDFNYGGPDPTEAEDVRRNETVRDALDRAGKLK